MNIYKPIVVRDPDFLIFGELGNFFMWKHAGSPALPDSPLN